MCSPRSFGHHATFAYAIYIRPTGSPYMTNESTDLLKILNTATGPENDTAFPLPPTVHDFVTIRWILKADVVQLFKQNDFKLTQPPYLCDAGQRHRQ